MTPSSGTNEYFGGNKTIINKQNSAGVVVAGSPTVIAVHGPISVNKGERYLVQVFVNAVKGAVAGEFLTTINAPESGGAAASFGAGRSFLLERGPHAALVSVAQSVSGVLTVTTTGSLTFQLLGTSTGSNSDVVAGEAQMSVVQL
ncbi:hypothetical protein [Ensifer sp. 4252]|uniref:hypothetical protein n=1 Tax=Ensifer sp. 4252 TaxID=3373915 RepID=UPI003D1E8FA3